MDSYRTNADGVEGWEQWEAGSVVVGKNRTSATQTANGITWPAQTIKVHPESNAFAVVSWRSPITGSVKVEGSVTDYDPNGGDGITWFIDRGDTTLAFGSYPNGASQTFADGTGGMGLASVAVTEGQTIDFLVGPGGSNLFDSTGLDVRITPSEGNPPPDTTAPQTTIDSGPGPTTSDSTPTFSFSSSEPESSFECRVDSAAFAPCNSPHTTAAQSDGEHTFEVRATDPAGNTDPTSASQTFTVEPPDPACAGSMTIDTVEVLADCIKEQSPGIFRADGNTRFSNGARIVTDGTPDGAPLILDPEAHSIALAPLEDGGERTGLLYAGSRAVATGKLTIDTRATADPLSGIGGLARLSGMEAIKLRLSGWGFLDSTTQTIAGATSGSTDTALFLVPAGSQGGGALVTGKLGLPFYFGPISGALAVQGQSDGKRRVRGGEVAVPESDVPGTPLKIRDTRLSYLDDGDIWRGRGELKANSFGKLVIDPVVVKEGKFDEIKATYDSTGCSSCGVNDPDIGVVLQLKRAELHAENLSGVNYAPPPPGCGAKGNDKPNSAACQGAIQDAKCPADGCKPPPRITGNVLVTALKNRVVGTGEFDYKLSGETFVHGHVAFAPAIPETFTFPDGFESVGSKVDSPAQGPRHLRRHGALQAAAPVHDLRIHGLPVRVRPRTVCVRHRSAPLHRRGRRRAAHPRQLAHFPGQEGRRRLRTRLRQGGGRQGDDHEVRAQVARRQLHLNHVLRRPDLGWPQVQVLHQPLRLPHRGHSGERERAPRTHGVARTAREGVRGVQDPQLQGHPQRAAHEPARPRAPDEAHPEERVPPGQSHRRPRLHQPPPARAHLPRPQGASRRLAHQAAARAAHHRRARVEAPSCARPEAGEERPARAQALYPRATAASLQGRQPPAGDEDRPLGRRRQRGRGRHTDRVRTFRRAPPPRGTSPGWAPADFTPTR